MTSKEKIEYLKRFERKSMVVAEFLVLAGFASVFLAWLPVSRNLPSMAVILFFLFILCSIILIAVINIFVKLAISYMAFAIEDRKTGTENLIPALLGVALLSFIFLLHFGSMQSGNSRYKARDARRTSDMRQLVTAQEMFFKENGRYFVCGQGGGDCRSFANNYPEAIGAYLTNTPLDPSGTEHPYAGIDNAGDPNKFCYYATLEGENKTAAGCGNGCGFYTATESGNFYVAERPKSFRDCTNLAQNAAVIDKDNH